MATAQQRQGEGWLVFAAIMLFFAGFGRVIDAFWAFKYNDDYPRFEAVLFDGNLGGYGWIWLIMGLLLIAAGFGVLQRAQWARWFGIIVAAVAGIAGLSWIYFQPLWSILAVIVNVLIIYALAVYGEREPVA
ncbi:MAG: hypothetical protein IPM45_11570 [Acidimicrobiales bacterium]|nr:hypothetical protein [Acidimicrobiales bacterium]